jgi:hypothetical protein
VAEDAERELPGEVRGVVDAGVEAKGAEDAVDVTTSQVSHRKMGLREGSLRCVSTNMNALVGA